MSCLKLLLNNRQSVQCRSTGGNCRTRYAISPVRTGQKTVPVCLRNQRLYGPSYHYKTIRTAHEQYRARNLGTLLPTHNRHNRHLSSSCTVSAVVLETRGNDNITNDKDKLIQETEWVDGQPLNPAGHHTQDGMTWLQMISSAACIPMFIGCLVWSLWNGYNYLFDVPEPVLLVWDAIK